MPDESFSDIGDLLSLTERRTYSEPCPFLDGKMVHFQSMTAAEQLEVMNAGDNAYLAISYCVVDPNGDTMFGKQHFEQLQKVDGRVIAWMMDRISKHCMEAPNIAAAEKN